MQSEGKKCLDQETENYHRQRLTGTSQTYIGVSNEAINAGFDLSMLRRADDVFWCLQSVAIREFLE